MAFIVLFVLGGVFLALGNVIFFLYADEASRFLRSLAAYSAWIGAVFFICAIYTVVFAYAYTACPIVSAPGPGEAGRVNAAEDRYPDYIEGEYFALQTLTSVGYGAHLSASPTHTFYRTSILAMIVGGIIWVLGVGSVATITFDIVRYLLLPPTKPETERD